MLKTKAEIQTLLERVEHSNGLEPARHVLIMAFEWILNGPISTSMGLEDWLAEETISSYKEVK